MAQMNTDSGLRARLVRIPAVTSAVLYSAAALPVINTAVTLLAGGSVVFPSNFALRFIADATVATRTVACLVKGRDQFGAPISETVTITATASQTVDAYTSKVYGRITSITPTTLTNVQAGDTMSAGPLALAASTKYGVGLELQKQDDILSLNQEAAAGTIAIFASTAAVLEVQNCLIKTFTGITLTNATFLNLWCYSSDL